MMRPNKSSDRKYMELALTLAKRGAGRVYPNPMVGCVIVRGKRIVGKGYHEYFGGPHAEINALKQAGRKARGSTMYVTLEPCSHHGKTPPCTEAILKAGVRRVLAATLDPDEKSQGAGIKALRRKSVDVSYGLLSDRAKKLNFEYVRSRRMREASVVVKAAMSVDGKIATRTGHSKWISSLQSRAYAHHLRSNVDAVVVGRKTVQKDNPLLTSHGAGPNPVRVVIDPDAATPPTSKIFNSAAPTIVLHASKAQRQRIKSLQRRNVMTVTLPTKRGKIDFRDVVTKLGQFSLKRVLVEGGGETIAAAIESGVVTDLVLFVAPMIIGGRSAISPVEGLGVSRTQQSVRLHGPRVRRIGPDFVLTAKVDRKQNR